MLVLPFKCIAGAGGMMPCHAARLCILRIIIRNYQAVDRVGVNLLRHLFCPMRNGLLNILQRRVQNLFVRNRVHSVLVQPFHARAPRTNFVVGVHQGEWNPL